MVVWNGTGGVISHVDVSGPAKDVWGTVVGSGDSQDIEPQNLSVGEVAFGMVFFTEWIPAGSTFDLSATARRDQVPYLVDAKVTQANFIADPDGFDGGSITGEVVNPNPTSMKGPIATVAYCFSDAGALLSVFPGFISGDGGLAPGATGGYSVSLFLPTSCPTWLVGASGYQS